MAQTVIISVAYSSGGQQLSLGYAVWFYPWLSSLRHLKSTADWLHVSASEVGQLSAEGQPLSSMWSLIPQQASLGMASWPCQGSKREYKEVQEVFWGYICFLLVRDNYHKLSTLTQHSLLSSQFYKIEVWHNVTGYSGYHKTKIKTSAGLSSQMETLGRGGEDLAPISFSVLA